MEVVTNTHIIQKLICDSGNPWAFGKLHESMWEKVAFIFLPVLLLATPREKTQSTHSRASLWPDPVLPFWLLMYPMPAVGPFGSFYTFKMSHGTMFWGRREVKL